jgi:DnaJ-domain-containing protein 1
LTVWDRRYPKMREAGLKMGSEMNGMMRLLQSQERILKVITEEVQGWMDALLRDAFNPEAFLRFVASMGIDLSQIPNMVGKQDGFDPYRVLGLDRSAPDEEVKKRYRELLKKLHPDTAGVRGTDFLLQMMMAAYQEIAKERRWQ